MPNVIMHFEIPADDVERAKTFYTKVFGWTIEPYPMPPGQEYFGVTAKQDGEQGINGGLMKRNMPGQPFTNYVTVDSIDRMMPVVQVNGGKFVLPKQEIGGGMGWIAAFMDPENNMIGLHQAGPNAPRPATATATAKVSASSASSKPRASAAKKPAKSGAKKKVAKKSGGKKKRR